MVGKKLTFHWKFHIPYKNLLLSCSLKIFSTSDGDKNKEDFRGWSVSALNSGGCKELFRAVWTGG